ncbi:putative Bracovirus protein MdBV-1-21 [Microplitis demolitor]
MTNVFTGAMNNQHNNYHSKCHNDQYFTNKLYNKYIDIYRRQSYYLKMNHYKNHIVVDFNGYNLTNNTYAIKEFSAIVAGKNSTADKNNLELLVKPPYKFENLPQEYKDKYSKFYKKYGIDWDAGTTSHNDVTEILTNYFETAKHIYVKNMFKKKLLELFIGERDDIECLENLGFKIDLKKLTDCRHHNESNSNCAFDNSKIMLRWLKRYVADGKTLSIHKKKSIDRLPENRILIPVSVKGQVLNALLDTGSTVTCVRELHENWIETTGMSSSDRRLATGADGHVMKIKSSVILPLVINDELVELDVRVVPKLGYEIILGIDAVLAFGIGLDGSSCSWWTERGAGIFNWN